MDKPNACGTCSACCRVYAVPEVQKTAKEWCKHCEIGKSCRIYETRPTRCVEYKCVWLELTEAGMNPPLELRPDHSKVVINMTTSPQVVDLVTMPNYPDAWKKPAIQALINMIVAKGKACVIGQPGSIWRTFISRAGTKQVEMTPPDADGMQYNVEKQVIL